MSLEKQIENLANAVNELVKVLTIGQNLAQEFALPAETAAVFDKAPTQTTPVVETPAVTPPPAFTFAPAPEPVQPVPVAPTYMVSPFHDVNGLMEYAMNMYQQLGAEKGAKIQNVLNAMGHQQLTELKPERYNEFYTEVEKLKS